MSDIVVREHQGEWEVWVGLELSDDTDVAKVSETFVIGSGKSKDEAIAEAESALALMIIRLREERAR